MARSLEIFWGVKRTLLLGPRFSFLAAEDHLLDCVPVLYVDIIANILAQYSGERLSTISHISQPWIGVAPRIQIQRTENKK